MSIEWKRFNAAEYCRRENLFKRHVYIPLGFEDKLGEEAILKFKDGRAILSGMTDAGKKLDRSYCIGSDLKVDNEKRDEEWKIIFSPGMACLLFL